MSRTIPGWEVWHPHTRQDREAVLAELQAVLASPHFCNSKRYPALLQYVVEKTLAGESYLLKERTLGIEVFDRSPDYDTNTDTVVRYTAGEVRKRLSLYYHELERKPAVQISLPPGSYIPEFLHVLEGQDVSAPSAETVEGPTPAELEPVSEWTLSHPVEPSFELHPLPEASVQPVFAKKRRWWITAAVFALVFVLVGIGWRYRRDQPKTALDQFWAPVLRDQSSMMVCIGGSVFSQTHSSGVATATKDIEYPFVSMQSASAAAQISALLDHNSGATTVLRAAATTSLTELREHPVILVGGYNNPWTVRLLQPLRFHFTDVSPVESIEDGLHPATVWQRDATLPYSSADDYAIVARFRDSTTDSWVVALAGIGRNGTEAAAQFATSQHYMQLLRDQAGNGFSNRNMEAVLKVSVIDGKTGAPSILAVHLW